MFSKFIAILLVTGFLSACGASGGGQPNPDPVFNNPSSTATISSAPTSIAASSVASQTSSISNSTASQTSSIIASSSSRSSSLAITSSSRSMATSSSRSSSVRSSSSSSRSSSVATQQATIQWSHPTQRANGDFLELSEIGGYEIRVRPTSNSSYIYYNISGNQTTNYVLTNYVSTMTVEIAVFDSNGLYSEFVTVSN
jgi:hypothetical protein